MQDHRLLGQQSVVGDEVVDLFLGRAAFDERIDPGLEAVGHRAVQEDPATGEFVDDLVSASAGSLLARKAKAPARRRRTGAPRPESLRFHSSGFCSSMTGETLIVFATILPVSVNVLGAASPSKSPCAVAVKVSPLAPMVPPVCA